MGPFAQTRYAPRVAVHCRVVEDTTVVRPKPPGQTNNTGNTRVSNTGSNHISTIVNTNTGHDGNGNANCNTSSTNN